MQSLCSNGRVVHSGRSLTVVGPAVEACMVANHTHSLSESFTSLTILFTMLITSDATGNSAQAS